MARNPQDSTRQPQVCTAIKIGIVLLGVSFFGLAHDWAGMITAKVFGVTSEDAKVTFLRVFQQYRLALVVLNIVPISP